MKWISVILLIFLPFTGCARVQTGLNRTERLLIGTEQEVEIGKSVAKNVEEKYKILNDPAIISYINEVGQQVAAKSFRQDVKYHFKVLDDENINALACPGGFIYIFGGALAAMENEAQLAFVLGHEIAHVSARHSAKKIQKVLGVTLLARLILKEDDETLCQIVNLATNLLFLGYSRRDEFEADELGVYFVHEANYDPQGGIEFFEILKKIQKREPSRIEVLFSSHPSSSDRINQIRGQIERLPKKEGLEIGENRFREMTRGLRGRYQKGSER